MQFISEAKGIVKCSYNDELKFTSHDWLTFFCDDAQSIIMREAVEQFLIFVRDNKVEKHLVDVAECTDAFTDEDQNWIVNYVVPKEIEYGIKYLANVVSNDFYTQLSTEDWQEKVSGGLIIKNFNSVDEAVEWLNSK